MKKLIISLITGVLLVTSSYSQWYEYTATKHINYFNGSQTEKTGVFHWEYDNWGGATFTQSNGEITIDEGVRKSLNINYYLDSIILDISSLPYMMIEAKADTIVPKVIVFVKDTVGGSNGWLDTLSLTTTYQTFIFDLTDGGSNLDLTKVGSIKFNQPGTTITPANDNLYIKHLALGDTTRTMTLIDDNEVEDANLVCYPNPAKDQLNISGIGNIFEAIITDLTGKVIMIIESGDVSAGIDVSGLASGMYIISCSTENGTIQDTFIKE